MPTPPSAASPEAFKQIFPAAFIYPPLLELPSDELELSALEELASELELKTLEELVSELELKTLEELASELELKTLEELVSELELAKLEEDEAISTELELKTI